MFNVKEVCGRLHVERVAVNADRCIRVTTVGLTLFNAASKARPVCCKTLYA